jgi:hypothetical protein
MQLKSSSKYGLNSVICVMVNFVLICANFRGHEQIVSEKCEI